MTPSETSIAEGLSEPEGSGVSAAQTGLPMNEAVPSSPAVGIPDADRAWAYARRLEKSLLQIAPKDIGVTWNGDKLWLTVTIATMLEADAVVAIIQEIAPLLISHRLMVREDIMPAIPKRSKPEFSAQMRAFLGDAQGIETGTAATECGPKGESPVATPCAKTEVPNDRNS